MTTSPSMRMWSWLILASTVIGTAVNYLVFGHEPGLGMTLFLYLMVCVYFITAVFTATKVRPLTLFLGACIIFFASMISIRGSHFLTFYNVVISFGLLFLLTRSQDGLDLKNTSITYYPRILATPLLYLRNSLSGVFALIQKLSPLKNHPNLSQILRGIIFAVPLVILFGVLLVVGDKAFEHFVMTYLFIDIDISEILVIKTILFFLFAFGSFGALYGSYVRSRSEQISTKTADDIPGKGLSPLEFSIIIGSVIALFTLFHLTQLSYFFSSAESLRNAGITFANYARRGFFELNFVTVIALVTMHTIQQVSQKTEIAQKRFTVLCGIMVVQLFLLLASSFYRLALYEQQYGLTIMRLYSHAFVVYLAVLVGCFFIVTLLKRPLTHFAFCFVISSIGYFGVMNIINPEAIITKYNLNQATVKKDYYYLLQQLSSDALPAFMQYYRTHKTDLDIADSAEIREIASMKKQHQVMSDTAWQAWNISRQRGAELIQNLP